MAKAKKISAVQSTVLDSSNLVYAKFGEIYHDWNYNYRQDPQIKEATLTDSMAKNLARNGWHGSYAINVWLATQADQDRCVSERQKLLAELELAGQKSPEKAHEYQVTRKLLCDENGEIIRPKYMGNTAFRRGRSIIPANIIRENAALAGDEDMPTETLDTLPVMINTYPTEAARMLQQFEENQVQLNNAKPHLRESFLAGWKLFRAQTSEARLRELFGGGNAQKCFNMYRAATLFPSRKYIERCTQTMHPEFLDLTKLDKEVVRKMLDAYEGTPQTLTGDQFEAELVNLSTKGKKSLGKVMKPDDIKKVIDRQRNNPYIAAAASSILKDDTTQISEIVDDEIAVSLVWKLCRAGHIDRVVAALSALEAELMPVKEPETVSAN